MPHSYQFKITIKNSHPPIWRRILVPDGITFRELDDIIEKLFGWTHDHMFKFSFPGDCYFVGTPIACEEDTVDRVIDRYISENDSFSYTYDFGDSWEHTIKVEKILEREERFPVVLKSKGPNMIEDCGGIWGFYDYIDEAEPFDMDRVNQSLSTWIYPVNSHNDLEDKEDFSEMPGGEDYDFQGKNILSDLLGMKADKESFINALEHIKAQENALQKGSMGVKSLKDVFNQYTKDNLKELAELHHFTRYNRFNKKELAEWLKNSFLETQFMKNLLKSSTEEEFRIFENAIKENGIMIPEELLSESVLLCTYGGYDPYCHFLQIPQDVQEKFSQICTPEFYEELKQGFLIPAYIQSAVYLYGAVSVKELKMLYRRYEGKDLSPEYLQPILDEIWQCKEPYCFIDDMIADSDLAEDDLYPNLLKSQSLYSRYIPDSREEFLNYGKQDSQITDDDTAFFMEYLTDTLGLDSYSAFMTFLSVEDDIRMNVTEEELFEEMETYGCKFSSLKRVRETQKQLRKFRRVIRKWDYNGHSENEIQTLNQSGNRKENSKIVAFPKKKIYPNDPCPCGSGKKYKHCCEKK